MPLLVSPKNVKEGDVCFLVNRCPEKPWGLAMLGECAGISSRSFRVGGLSAMFHCKVDSSTLGGYAYRRYYGPSLRLDLSQSRLLGIVLGEVPLEEDNFECIKFMRKVVRRHKAEILR